MENREKALLTCVRSGNYVSYRKVVDDDILQVDVKKIDRANALLSLGCILQFFFTVVSPPSVLR